MLTNAIKNVNVIKMLKLIWDSFMMAPPGESLGDGLDDGLPMDVGLGDGLDVGLGGIAVTTDVGSGVVTFGIAVTTDVGSGVVIFIGWNSQVTSLSLGLKTRTIQVNLTTTEA